MTCHLCPPTVSRHSEMADCCGRFPRTDNCAFLRQHKQQPLAQAKVAAAGNIPAQPADRALQVPRPGSGASPHLGAVACCFFCCSFLVGWVMMTAASLPRLASSGAPPLAFSSRMMWLTRRPSMRPPHQPGPRQGKLGNLRTLMTKTRGAHCCSLRSVSSSAVAAVAVIHLLINDAWCAAPLALSFLFRYV